MSRPRRRPRLGPPGPPTSVLALMVAATFVALAAGCCGSGPTHKCEFGPPTRDASPEVAPPPCGKEVCELPAVCCIKKVPLSAMCVDQSEFVSQGCEVLDLPCVVPSDCPAGLVCCVQFEPTSTVACRPESLCPGTGSTLRACASASDCPPPTSSCNSVESDPDGGPGLQVCF